MNLKLSKPTKLDWIALCVFLACVASLASFVYNLSSVARWKSVKPYMYREISADIIDPLESRYDLTDKERKYGVYMVELPPDDTIVLSIRLEPKDGEQAFHIARDVYELKRKSPVLSRKPMELKIRVRDPKSGIDIHTFIPGAPDHKKKRDFEEYMELNRKWVEIDLREEQDRRRAAAGNGEEDSTSTEESGGQE